jgi:hypothetical protein
VAEVQQQSSSEVTEKAQWQKRGRTGEMWQGWRSWAEQWQGEKGSEWRSGKGVGMEVGKRGRNGGREKGSEWRSGKGVGMEVGKIGQEIRRKYKKSIKQYKEIRKKNRGRMSKNRIQ